MRDSEGGEVLLEGGFAGVNVLGRGILLIKEPGNDRLAEAGDRGEEMVVSLVPVVEGAPEEELVLP